MTYMGGVEGFFGSCVWIEEMIGNVMLVANLMSDGGLCQAMNLIGEYLSVMRSWLGVVTMGVVVMQLGNTLSPLVIVCEEERYEELNILE